MNNALFIFKDLNIKFKGYASGGSDFVQGFFPKYGACEPYAIQIAKFGKIREKKDITIEKFNFRKKIFIRDKDGNPIKDENGEFIRDEKKEREREILKPTLSPEKNIEFYNFLCNMIDKMEFIKNKPGKFNDEIKNNELFYKLKCEDQVQYLFNIIKYFNGERVKVPDNEMGYYTYEKDKEGNYKRVKNVTKGNEGKGRMSKDGYFSAGKKSSITVVNQSVTGLYENSTLFSLDDDNE